MKNIAQNCPNITPAVELNQGSGVSVSNLEFYDAVFHTIDDGATAWGTQFSVAPDHATNGDWFGGAIKRRTMERSNNYNDGEHNTYHSVSSFKPGRDGRVYRRIANYSATHGITFDDIGDGPSAKVSWDRVVLEPSYAIETSPGNCQVGYILAEPEHDADKVDRVVDAIVSQGLAAEADPGMKGRTRYVRMPVGVNNKTKYDPPHKHVVKSWNPERRYTLEEIVTGYGLELAPQGSTTIRKREPIDASHDPYLKALDDIGLILTGNIRGEDQNMVDILCPWHEEHTDRADEGAVYYMGGGFHCFHGHCIERTFKDMKVKLKSDYGVDIVSLSHELRLVQFQAERNAAQAVMNALTGAGGVK